VDAAVHVVATDAIAPAFDVLVGLRRRENQLLWVDVVVRFPVLDQRIGHRERQSAPIVLDLGRGALAQGLDGTDAAVDDHVRLQGGDGPTVAGCHLVVAWCQRQFEVFVHLAAQPGRRAQDGGGLGEKFRLTHLTCLCDAAAAGDLWRDERLRTMPPDEAAVDWLKLINEEVDFPG